ncbi:hypothetical protein BASA83_002459 [Batrachochytrium salamandrivorans]|nr:hypothetical protein BASA83_002459 [Batrachochytrium salamandrivorans]
MTTKQLTRRQARWSLFLAEFRFNLAYRPGSHNGKADRLSRRPDFKVDEEPQNLVQMLNPSMVVAPLDSSTAIFSPTLRRIYRKTKAGNRHIVTAIDYATRWVVAKAVPNRGLCNGRFILIRPNGKLRITLEILTDRGSAFLSEGVKEFEARQRIRHHATTTLPSTHKWNGRTHARNGKVMRITTLNAEDNQKGGMSTLAQTIFAIRVRKTCCNTNTLRFFILYGVEPTPSRRHKPPKGNNDALPRPSRADGGTRRIYCSVLGRNWPSPISSIRTLQAQAEAMRIRNKWDPDSDDYYFKIGDMVKLKNHTKNKFEFDWRAHTTLSMWAIRERIG